MCMKILNRWNNKLCTLKSIVCFNSVSILYVVSTHSCILTFAYIVWMKTMLERKKKIWSWLQMEIEIMWTMQTVEVSGWFVVETSLVALIGFFVHIFRMFVALVTIYNTILVWFSVSIPSPNFSSVFFTVIPRSVWFVSFAIFGCIVVAAWWFHSILWTNLNVESRRVVGCRPTFRKLSAERRHGLRQILGAKYFNSQTNTVLRENWKKKAKTFFLRYHSEICVVFCIEVS